ncbi:UNVERIFIED_CONTAM: hypothetical protein H355_011290 [Colinus virginianus]|nr:hypothetical protein H355_011290 [Colinus virginianus]
MPGTDMETFQAEMRQLGIKIHNSWDGGQPGSRAQHDTSCALVLSVSHRSGNGTDHPELAPHSPGTPSEDKAMAAVVPQALEVSGLQLLWVPWDFGLSLRTLKA